MSIDSLKQKTTVFIQELRGLREEAIRGNLAMNRALFLMRTKLQEYEEDAVVEPFPFPDNHIHDFFKVVKWHYWNILYSLFGDELANIDSQFNRIEVPYLLPGIEILFEKGQLPPPEPAQDMQAQERKADKELPPVIKAVLEEGLLNGTQANGKYLKTGDKKDSEIIEWIFDYSGYGDSLTADLYMRHIVTSCKSTTIQDYITRKKRTPD